MSVSTLSPPSETDQPPRTRRVPSWLTVLAVSLPMFMATLDNLVMTTALPVVRADLGATVTQLSWFVNAYSLAFATFMLPAAALGDRIGRRRVMLAGITIFALASIGSALSNSPEALIAARALQGFGAAAVMPLSLTLLAGSVPERVRPAAIGIWGGVAGLGVAVGPVVGGAVVDGISWPAIFWLNVPVAAVALPLLIIAARESRGRQQPVDVLGTALLGAAVFLAVWGIVHGNDDGWSSVKVLLPLIIAGLLIPLYIAHAARRQRNRRDAVLPLRLFRHRGFTVANLSTLLFSIGVLGAVFLLSQYLQVVQGYSPLEAGIRTLPWTAAPMIIAPLAGAVAGRIGPRVPMVLGLALQAGALAWLAAVSEAGADYPSFIVPLALAGVGMGMTFAPLSTAVLQNLHEADFGIASSSRSTMQEFGTALGVALLVAVFQAAGGTISPDGYDGAIGPALLTASGAAALAAVIATFAPGRVSR